ncbi:hypothetical protein [Effusibacillus pohliae]|uniref:hypothetical protein n=1 Tax=Effusibacillus pohliae TaxID=232270 RepID=UPI0003786080|nr:hypothetical protein [Effusibacillus pohliae]
MQTRNTVILLISLLIAIAGAAMYAFAKRAGEPIPYYVMGMLAYGLVFVGYTAIDSAARNYKKRYRGK